MSDSMDAQSPSISSIRRNKEAELEAALDEATQRNMALMDRLRDLLGGNLEDEFAGLEYGEEDET